MPNLNQPEPMPTPNQLPAMWPLVIADMQARHELGVAEYGTVLQPFNRRNALNDLKNELLDACVYLQQLQFEDALSERQAIKALLTDIINAPVLSRAWGDEFCPVCEKPIMSDDDCEDLDRFAEIYGVDGEEYTTAVNSFCSETHSDWRIFESLCQLREENVRLKRALKDAVLQEVAQMELEDG